MKSPFSLKKFKNISARRALSRGFEALAFVGLGIIIGILILRYDSFEFDWKFDVLHFLTLILTLVVSFLLQRVLSQRTDADKVEKQIIIAGLQSFEANLRKVSEICRASAFGELNEKSARDVLLEFRTLNNQLDTLDRLFRLSPLRANPARVGELRRRTLGLKQLTTGKNFPAAPLTFEEYSKVRLDAAKLFEAIFQFVIEVNRL